MQHLKTPSLPQVLLVGLQAVAGYLVLKASAIGIILALIKWGPQ